MSRERYFRVKVQKRYPKGRICDGDSCSAVLSIYNSDHLCARCDDALVPA